MRRLRTPALLLLLVLSAGAVAESVSERLQRVFTPDSEEILPPDAAFRFTLDADGATAARAYWQIEDGYYLYRDKFDFEVVGGGARVDKAALVLPQGHIKEDEVFGRVEVNTGEVEIRVPLAREPGAALPLKLAIHYQGCKEESVCYPPIRKEAEIVLAAWGGADTAAPGPAPPLSGQDAISRGLQETGLAGNLLAFFGFGLLLAFTPCVFPMVPILSGILIGGAVSARRGFVISLAYVVAMAATYAVLGAIAGSLQINLQAASQTPWVILLFSAVFVGLALSMFGLYELQLPDALRQRLSGLQARQVGGSLRGAAIMGVLSALIAGPCVAPPLAGALLYITQTGDALLGAAALFAMGLGFGVPLLAVGASAGTLLPRAGAWMETVKRTFGVVMLGVAVWLLGRILPGPVELLLWALLFIGAGAALGVLDRVAPKGNVERLGRGLGLALVIYGATLVVGAATGGDDVLRPLARFAGGPQLQHLPFRPVADLAALDRELAAARREGRPAMLDFYADWCVECIRMERTTFQDPRVRNRLAEMHILQADVTGYDEGARALLEAFELYGPPATLFFDRNGSELRPMRITGYADADGFLRTLDAVIGS